VVPVPFATCWILLFRLAKNRILERCPSGLRSTPGKRVYVNAYRGFESLSLRQTKKGPAKAGLFFAWRRERVQSSLPVRPVALATWTAKGAPQGTEKLTCQYQESLPHERSECFGYGEVVDVYLQKRRDSAAAKRFFKRLLKTYRGEPRKIITDKLRSYNVAHRELIPDSIHDKSLYANNRAELSHQPTRVRERGMRRFKSIAQAQRFLGVHLAVYNLFNLCRHLISASHYRLLRLRAFVSWKSVAA
jgi:hypothetical protein